MQHAFQLADNEYGVAVSRAAEGYRLHLDERHVPFDLQQSADGRVWLSLNGQRHEVAVATRGDDVFIHFQGETYQLRYLHALDRLAAQTGSAAEDSIRAPMPGSIVAVEVEAGQIVSKGQILLVMESMKMESTIIAPRDAVVQSISFVGGQVFDRDALLISLEPLAAQEASE